MFQASVDEGGCAVERWYKVMPSPDFKAAVKTHGAWWGVTEENPIEINLRFLAFS